jgi:ribonuclease J
VLSHNQPGIPRYNICVCFRVYVFDITTVGDNNHGRIQVGGIMYDDSGATVSEVVLKDRIHMAAEGMFVIVLTVARGSGRLMTSPDIISRGFIYLRDSEELMGMIRQYLKQKVARSFTGKRVDLDVIKKELKDEITHILYDQTRRTPIVIPVINEIGGGGGGQNRQGGGEQRNENRGDNRNRQQNGDREQRFQRPAPKEFPAPQVPDTEATEPRNRVDSRPY